MRTREEIKAARKAFARQHDGRQKDMPARRVAQLCDTAAEAAQAAAELAIADASLSDDRLRFALPNSPDSQVYDRLVKLFVIGHPDFRAWLTERVEEVAPTFCVDMTTAEFKNRMDDFDKELAEIEVAGKRGEIASRQAEIDAEFAALEQD